MGNRSHEVDAYLESIPAEHRQALEKLRDLIHEIHVDVDEAIEYKMPTFKLNGEMVTGFSSRARYISLYCKPEVVDEHRDALGKLNVGKGCIRFGKYEQLPVETIRAIIQNSRP